LGEKTINLVLKGEDMRIFQFPGDAEFFSLPAFQERLWSKPSLWKFFSEENSTAA
jgi:hypothetical protein